MSILSIKQGSVNAEINLNPNLFKPIAENLNSSLIRDIEGVTGYDYLIFEPYRNIVNGDANYIILDRYILVKLPELTVEGTEIYGSFLALYTNGTELTSEYKEVNFSGVAFLMPSGAMALSIPLPDGISSVDTYPLAWVKNIYVI